MISAETHRKVPKIDNKEDILTSNVFDLLELIDYKYLLNVLKNARTESGNKLTHKLENKTIASVQLWKNFKTYGEPDVYVTLDDDTHFIIEVKYFGEEHSNKKNSDNDEDMDELDTQEYKEKGQLKKYLRITENEENNFIVYLTSSYLSLKELSDDSREKIDYIYHIHWKDFNKYLKEHLYLSSGCEKKILKNITNYLDFKGFEHWNGFRSNYENIITDIGGFYDN